jgi:hypothetical protein
MGLRAKRRFNINTYRRFIKDFLQPNLLFNNVDKLGIDFPF